MIIHEPEITQKDGYFLLWSRIELSKPQENFPEYLWYRVPEQFGQYLERRNDAFLVASLIAGMHFAEDIHVRGTVSPRLAYHLNEYQFILNFRMPKVMHPVSITYEYLAPLQASQSGVGTTFTGGVDSLFTVWSHLSKNQPIQDYQITHGVFIHGFDILYTARNHYDQLFNKFEKQASKNGIELIELGTNVVSVGHQRVNLSYLYGPLIISAGLALTGLFKRFYIPSSWDYYTLQHVQHASDPLVDGLLSTDSTEIIHHGSTYRRIEKVEKIADWDTAQEILWVCLDHQFKENSWNCSRCEKCVRTMIPLHTLGKLKHFKTFEKPMNKNYEVLWYARKFNLRSNYISEILAYMKGRHPEILPWLYMATFLGYFRSKIIENLPHFIQNWLRRYGYFIPRNEAPDAYEVGQITEYIRTHYESKSTQDL